MFDLPLFAYISSLFLAYYISMPVVRSGQLNDPSVKNPREISFDLGILTIISFVFWYVFQSSNTNFCWKRYLLTLTLPTISCLTTLGLMETEPFQSNFSAITSWSWTTWLAFILIIISSITYVINNYLYRHRRYQARLSINEDIEEAGIDFSFLFDTQYNPEDIVTLVAKLFLRLFVTTYWLLIIFLSSGVYDDFYLHHMVLFAILAVVIPRPRTLHLIFVGISIHGLVAYNFPMYLIHEP